VEVCKYIALLIFNELILGEQHFLNLYAPTLVPNIESLFFILSSLTLFLRYSSSFIICKKNVTSFIP